MRPRTGARARSRCAGRDRPPSDDNATDSGRKDDSVALQITARDVQPPPGPFLDLDALNAVPLHREPYEWLLVPGFVRPAGLAAINVDDPAIAGPTAFVV